MDIQKVAYSHNGILFGYKKRSGGLTAATIWMNLESMMLSKRNYTQKATCYMTSFL